MKKEKLETEKPKVTVIIPVYNGERYLKQCMDSIVGQTLKDIEILCVDDGSSDKSLEIMESYMHRDKRIKVICQKNSGAGAARNKGMSLAKGEYLSFLDADDFFEPDMLEQTYKKAKKQNAQVLVFGSDQYREDLGTFCQVGWTLRKHALPPYRPMDHRTFTENVFKVFVGWTWDKLFEREFVQGYKLNFQEQRTSNDLLFVFMAIVLAERIEIEEKILVHQRRNNPKSLSNTREQSWQCFYEALTALRINLVKYGLYYELEQDFINYALHFSLWNLNTLQGEKKRELCKMLKKRWFRELGITEHKKEYFYDQREYEQYREMTQSYFW